MDDVLRLLPLTTQQFQILLSLTEGHLHGYGIIRDVAARTAGSLRLGTGTLYTAIGRLVELALITDTGREDERRRFYKLLPLGRAVLKAETARLETLVRYAYASGVKPAPGVPRRS